jgi:centrosomal protein CEP152
MNSTHNSTQQHSSYHNKNFQEFPLRSEENHMRNMLESRNRELEYVTNQLAMERKQNKSTVDEFEKRLAIADAEKERAIMTRDQTHELLVENKSKLIEIQETNDKLHSKIKSLEKENSSLVGELESTKYMLQDVQLKYNMVEKNITINADKNTDKILKQTQERHNAQMTMMQQQVECIQSKFDDLEHEYKNLEIRYKELQRSRESILIEKSETINQMNKNLEDAQRQCQELLSRPNLSQENRQLQNLVHVLENDKDELNITISRLRKKVNEQQQEMEMMDSIVQECGGINGSFSETSKFINREPLKSVNSSTPVGPEARLARVKEELCKSLNNIKNKREELKICEKQLAEKDKEIKQLKLDENKALSQLSHFRDEAIRLESKTKVLEKELEATRSELKAVQTCTNDETIEREMKKLQAENDRLEEELTNLKLNYEKLCMKNEEFMENEREWKKIAAELENLQNSSKIVEELEREKEKVQKLNDELKKLSMIEKVDRETQKDNQEQDQISTSMKSTDDECPKYEDLLTKYEKVS